MHLFPHRAFDGVSGIGHPGRQQLRARCSDEIHILEEKALTIDRGNRFEVDGRSGAQGADRSAGREVAGMDLPIGNLASIRSGVNCLRSAKSN